MGRGRNPEAPEKTHAGVGRNANSTQANASDRHAVSGPAMLCVEKEGVGCCLWSALCYVYFTTHGAVHDADPTNVCALKNLLGKIRFSILAVSL